MRIIAIRPEPSGSGRILARFDWEFSPHLRMLNFVLKLDAAGEYRVFAPFIRDKSGRLFPVASTGNIAATLSPTLAGQITDLAVAAYQRATQKGQNAVGLTTA